MSRTHKTATGVFQAEPPVVCLGAEELTLLREEAGSAPLRRARICTHGHAGDPLHEMIIALCRDSYIPPHRHVGKSESFHVIEGEALVCLFDDLGNVRQVIPLGGKHCFFYRLSTAMYHTVLVQSPLFVFHETTNGPFDAAQTCIAPFVPPAEDTQSVHRYMDHLRALCAAHVSQS